MTTTNKATFRLNRPKLGRTGFASLLCSVSFLALSGGALAVDECGPGADGGTVNCNLVAYPTGISYKAGSAHSNFTVNVGAAAGQAGAVTVGNPGIGMGTVSGAHGSQTLRVTGDVTVNTTTDHGLFAATGTGFVNIYTAAQVIVNSMGTHHGVYANVDTNSISSINMFSSADNGGGPAGSVSITGGNGHGLFAFNGQTGSAIASAGTGTSISTLGGAGIYAKSVSGNASASTDGSIVTTLGGFGIKGYAGGSSVNLSLGQNGSIQTQGASAHGIFAESVNANGDATVIVSGDIDTQSDQSEGVRAVSNGNVYVRVTAPGSINGGSSGGAGIKVDAGTDAMEEATIKIEGLVEARSDRAIHGGDSIELVNIEAGGTVVGYLELRENDDIVTNKGTWIARGSTNTDFGTGSDTFDNQALFVVIGNQSLDGLETFNNSGTISLQETDSGMFDNGPDFETLTIAADFTASGASRIEIDTALGDNTSSTDVVVLTGAIMGSTTLAINNLGGMGGATAGNGILVIDTSAATGVDASSFALDGGTIDVNGFIYSLVLGGDNNWYLQSVAPPPPPPSSMGNFASIGFGANWLWQDTLKSYQDRVGEVWDLLAPSGHQTAALGAGDYEQEAVLPGAGGRGIQQIWLRGQGGFLDHDGSSGSNPFSQNYVGFQGGADMGWRNLFGGDDLLIVGGFLGIVDSDINMGASAADARLHGFQGGLYMAYMDGALRIDGTVKADFLNVDLVDPDTATDVEGDATTWGAQIAAAYRFGFEGIGAGGYLEPFVNLSFATSNIDSLLLGNASTVTFDEGETLWAGIGIKAATRFDVGGATLVPDVSVAYRGQLLDASQAVVGGSTLEADSQGSAVDLGLGMTVLGLNDHMTVNFSGNYLVGEEYDALSGQVAVKLTW